MQYERNRRNLNLQAAGNGINTGTGSQQQLALNQQFQSGYNDIQRAQADAQAEAQQKIADLTTQYQLSVQEALANNDYQRAQALYDEYNNGQQRDLKAAQIMAEFGDFSGYNKLYGKDVADNMANVWKFQNPDLAWNLGKITGEDYYKATGNYPRGYTPPNSGSFGGGGSSEPSWYQQKAAYVNSRAGQAEVASLRSATGASYANAADSIFRRP